VVHRQEDIPDPLDELKSLSEGMKDSKIHVKFGRMSMPTSPQYS